MNAKKYIVGVFALVIALTGCAALQQGHPAAKTAVQVATIKVIDEDPERAQRVREIAGKVRTLISGDGTTRLDAVESYVRGAIDWTGLDTAEKLVVNNLIDTVQLELENRINAQEISADDRVAIDNVLTWIEQAAAMAAGSASREQPETAAGAAAV